MSKLNSIATVMNHDSVLSFIVVFVYVHTQWNLATIAFALTFNFLLLVIIIIIFVIRSVLEYSYYHTTCQCHRWRRVDLWPLLYCDCGPSWLHSANLHCILLFSYLGGGCGHSLPWVQWRESFCLLLHAIMLLVSFNKSSLLTHCLSLVSLWLFTVIIR